MTKYVITSGHSVVNMFLEDREKTSVEITSKAKNSIKFDTIGEAIRCAAKINGLLGAPIYKAAPIET